MDNNHVDAATAMQHREGGYGGELVIQWSALEDEIREITMPMPDVASLRKAYEIRRDTNLTDEQIKEELTLNQQINYHFSSLKANFRNLDSCRWMRGVQIDYGWARLGDPRPVKIANDFDDALWFDINVIESQLYPEGVAVVVATVPNDGSRRPIQRPRALRRVKADVLLSDILAISKPAYIAVQDLIDYGVLKPLKSGSTYDVRVVVDPESMIYEKAPHYGFNVDDKDGRTIECVAATKQATVIMNLLDINYKRPPKPKHIPPFEFTNIDVGYFSLPARYSGWKRYISELNACYRELVDLDDGYGAASESDLPDEVGENNQPKPLISEEEMIRNLRAPTNKRPMARHDIIRRRKAQEKELEDAQGETEDLVPELDKDIDSVFFNNEETHLNIDDLHNI
tara:strand:- start:16117 stop:17313 length:1197 start_codon:yes stop_codon:yes gene_type:complete